MVSCAEHRTGLRLLAVKVKLAEENLEPSERELLEAEAAWLESELEMD